MSSLDVLRSVHRRYGKREVVRVVQRDSVASGGWLCLIGPNGAGKSSILRAAVGLVAHGGECVVDGVSLALRVTVDGGRRWSRTCRRTRCCRTT